MVAQRVSSQPKPCGVPAANAVRPWASPASKQERSPVWQAGAGGPPPSRRGAAPDVAAGGVLHDARDEPIRAPAVPLKRVLYYFLLDAQSLDHEYGFVPFLTEAIEW